jgi:hypothetical protein
MRGLHPRIFCCGIHLAKLDRPVPNHWGALDKMKRYISATVALLLIFATSPALTIWGRVAAQELQQSQTSDTVAAALDQRPSLQIPEGTPIEIEAPYTYRSIDFKPNDRISFRVVNPIKIDGVTVIEQGATATGRIEKAKRGDTGERRAYLFGRCKRLLRWMDRRCLSAPFLYD